MLSAEEVAYMREEAAGFRPTEATLSRRTQTTSPSGGRVDSWSTPEPIQVRLDAREQMQPNQVTAIVGSAKAVKFTMDLVDVRAGDIIRVGLDEYQAVVDAVAGEWATAQVVWAKRTKAAPRA